MKLYLLAGEPSGDRLGAALMRGLKQLSPGVEFAGVAGPEMQAEGMQSPSPMEELSVLGLAEVKPISTELRRRLQETARDCLAAGPEALITIDSPDFSLRLARLVKEQRPGMKTIHYVAPSVWAWRSGRAEKMARYIDHVLALLPFEPPYMEKAGMSCDFVGHPVSTEDQASDAEVAAFRTGSEPIVLVLPGSRRNEVARLSPIFGEALRPVLAAHPQARIVVPAAAPVASAVIDAVKSWPGTPEVIDPRDDPDAASRKRAAFRAADVALAASGTVSLELAAAATPMVIAYDMNWLTWQIMSRMVKLETVTLVNLVAGRNAVPEFLGPRCTPQPIGKALAELLSDPASRADQLAAMEETMTRLGKGGKPPGLRAARSVLGALGSARET